MDNSSTYGLEPTPRQGTSLLGVLRRRAMTVLVVTLLAGAAAAAFALASPTNYQATSKLLFQQTIGADLNALGLLPSSPDADNLSADAVEIVNSKRVSVATSRALRSRGIDVSADDLDDDVIASAQKDSDVVDVLAQADSADRAALVASVYAQQAARLAEADERSQARRAATSLGAQLVALPAKVREDNIGAGAELRAKFEKMRTIASVGTGSPRIIQRGFKPTSEASKPLAQTVVLGLLFGLVLGVGLALVREQTDRRLRGSDEISGAFDAPVLTTVPRQRGLKKHLPFEDLPPQVAEAFRMLYVNLRYRQGERVRTVLVTSSRAREGKTTVAWNLASAAASSGLTVALVEADMRRPALATRYQLAPEPGLAEILSGEVATAEALQSLYPLSSNVSGNGRPAGRLHVIVAGRPPHDPWALTQSPAMDQVLDALEQRHDLVILDTPPIPHVADAIALLRRVDGVVVVALLNNLRGPEAQRLRDQLTGLGAPVLGIVANGGSASEGYAKYVPAAAPRGDLDGPPQDGGTVEVPEYLPRR